MPEGATWCGDCKGLGWHGKKVGYISLCMNCSGKGYIEPNICECGKVIEHRGHTKCCECRQEEMYADEFRKNQERYEKAKKIEFKDYEGKFWDENWFHVRDSEDLEEWIYECIENGEEDEIPKWMFGTEKKLGLSIDIKEVIQNVCEDGYEDMYDSLDTKSLNEIQNQINKWIEDQGESAYVYNIDYSVVIELDEIIREIKDEIDRKNNPLDTDKVLIVSSIDLDKIKEILELSKDEKDFERILYNNKVKSFNIRTNIIDKETLINFMEFKVRYDIGHHYIEYPLNVYIMTEKEYKGIMKDFNVTKELLVYIEENKEITFEENEKLEMQLSNIQKDIRENYDKEETLHFKISL